jgi:RNA polymerase sigma factor (sigma-70 family)
MLTERSDEELIAEVRAAYAGNDRGRLDAAWGLLQYRHQKRVRVRVRAKLPDDLADELVQDILLKAFEAVIGTAKIEHFGGWLNGVVVKTIADFWRGKGGKAVNAVREGVALDDDRPDAPAYELGDDGGFDRADVALVIEDVLAKRNPEHREIIRLNVLEGRAAKDVADTTGASADNVYQVAKRFRDDLRTALTDDDTTQDRT